MKGVKKLSEDKIVDAVVDFANALESASVKLKMQFNEKQEKREWTWNPNLIKWEKAQGSKGEFERSEDINNLQFKAMQKDLADHSGKLNREGMFYWTFQNGSMIGRKQRS